MNGDKQMTVSFCIIAYNEEKALPSLLEDVKRQTYPHSSMEIVLVDSVSTDRTKDLMQRFAKEDNGFLRVVLLDNPAKKQASGWNVAIKAARGDIILRIDAHTMIPETFVEKSVECIEAGEYVSGGPRPNIIESNTTWQKTLLLAEMSMFGSSIAPYRKGHHKRYVKSVFHGAYRREVFEKAGLFNESLGRTEDNEMHYRIRKAGYKICYNPNIISYQYIRNSWHGMVKQKYLNGYWVGQTLWFCPKCFSSFHFIPLLFCLALFTALLCLWQGCRLPLLALTIIYGGVNLMMSLVAIIKEGFSVPYLLLPFIFLSLHVGYGVGTAVGIIVGLWKHFFDKDGD